MTIEILISQIPNFHVVDFKVPLLLLLQLCPIRVLGLVPDGNDGSVAAGWVRPGPGLFHVLDHTYVLEDPRVELVFPALILSGLAREVIDALIALRDPAPWLHGFEVDGPGSWLAYPLYDTSAQRRRHRH